LSVRPFVSLSVSLSSVSAVSPQNQRTEKPKLALTFPRAPGTGVQNFSFKS